MMALSEARHVFTFVVAGVELSEEQKVHVSAAIGQAGTAAVAHLNPHPELVEFPFNVKYRGRILIEALQAEQLSLGQLQAKYGGVEVAGREA